MFWTQPTSIRLDGESVIANLDVYPNPSRDIFNVSFTSEEAQDITVKVINVLGERLLEMIDNNLKVIIIKQLI